MLTLKQLEERRDTLVAAERDAALRLHAIRAGIAETERWIEILKEPSSQPATEEGVDEAPSPEPS